jgi:hypothetical protein
MALDDDTIKMVEELKEAGHEFRYREQFMVQEFSLSMVASGVLLGVLAKDYSGMERLALQFVGLLFLCVLSLHLRNTNQDRTVALRRKVALSQQLGFEVIHQNATARTRLSSSLAMIRFAAVVTALWSFWLAGSLWSIIRTT